MHELGVVMEVVRVALEVAQEQKLKKIDTIVLQIGELSSVIPVYVEQCFPAAADGTLLQDARLEIEILPGNALCKECGKVFNILANKQKCPDCASGRWELLGGREFYIEEIVAY